MTDDSTPLTWKISIVSPIPFLPALEEVLQALHMNEYPTVASFEIPDNQSEYLMEGYFNQKPDSEKLTQDINRMADIFNIETLTFEVELLEDKDWVSESQKLLKPVNAGRFFLYGNHDVHEIPEDRISILMEAGQAFGTGSHETTNGCLLAIDELRDQLNPENILDLGCGSGVLAIAMAKIWNANIVASDIDPIATDTTVINIEANKVENISAITSDGFEHKTLSSSAPYDLIVANILAKPLQMLAPEISNHLKKEGSLVLSGLLKIQEEAVLE
ncbi:MAG: 50S ribosomal protein L11 methyltransferase, partial [Emcibacteraceae bacterium]|nr:50S ribosomal protein L11 methyltransferase [Emcibacteraceae bacterium]